MANKTQVKGFEPFGRIMQANVYTATSAVYPGDLLVLDSSGGVAAAAAGTGQKIGVALSYAAAAGTVLVADHPQQRFLCEVNGANVDVASDLNLNYDISVGTASTLYKRSAMKIAHASGASDSNLPIKVLKLGPAVDNEFGANVDVVCMINNHVLKGETGSLGV